MAGEEKNKTCRYAFLLEGLRYLRNKNSDFVLYNDECSLFVELLEIATVHWDLILYFWH